MLEPIVYSGDGLHLDGILAAAAFRALDERTRRRMPPLTSDFPVDVKLPLARWVVDVGDEWGGNQRLLHKHKGGGQKRQTTLLWGWCASAVQATWLQHGQIEMRKKPDLDAIRRYTSATSANISSGALKAYDLAFPTSFARELTWYALGDRNAVSALLRNIVAIGGKRGTGSGTVERWSVEVIDGDRSIINDGRLMRRMPVQSGLPGQRGRMAIRPPYHHHSRIVDSVDPRPEQ